MRMSIAILAILLCSLAAHAQVGRILDKLDRAVIPAEERIAEQPMELVAILGSQRGRHWSPLTCLAHSPDGKHIACGADNGAICIWDANTLQEVSRLSAHDGRLFAIAYSPDGKTLASAAMVRAVNGGDTDGEVKIWDLPNGKLRARIVGNIGHFWSRAVAFDGDRLVCAGEDKIVRQWDMTKSPPKLQSELRGHKEHVHVVAFGPDNTVVSGDDYGTLRTWDAQTATEVASRSTAEGQIVSLAFRADGKELLSCSRGNVMRLWEWQNGKPTERLQWKLKNQLVHMALSRDGKQLAVTDDNAVVHLWDLTRKPSTETAALEPQSKGFPGEWYYHKVVFSPDGKTLTTIGGYSHAVRQWDVSAELPKERRFPPGSDKPVLHVAFSPDGRQIVATSGDNKAWIWEYDDKCFRQATSWSIDGDRYGWDPAAISTDGKTVAVVHESEIQLWNLGVRPPRVRATVLDDSRPKEGHRWSAMAFAPDPRTLAVGGYKRPIEIIDWTAKQPAHRRSLPNKPGAPSAMAFSHDGKMLAVGGQVEGDPDAKRDVVRVYDVEAGKERWTFERSKTWIDGLRFAPDDRTLAVSWRHGQVTLIEVASRKKRLEIVPGKHGPYAAAYTSDSKLLATAGPDGQVAVWDVWALGEKRWTTRLPGPVADVAWAPDRRHLATANANGSVYILRMP